MLYTLACEAYHSSCFLPSADTYLLQIQPYNFTSSKSKTEAKPETATKSESDDSAPPAVGQKEAVPQWYDVDVVKGTQYTVSGYSVKVDTPTEQGQEVRGLNQVFTLSNCNIWLYRNQILLLLQVFRK